MEKKTKIISSIGTLAVAGAVAIGIAIAAGGGSASAGSPVVTVSPSSNLNDVDTVGVSATGLAANTTYHIGECAQVGAAGLACNRADAKDATTDGNGAFSTTVTVRRSFEGYVGADLKPWGTVNCDAVGCGVGASDNNGVGGGASIFFRQAAAATVNGIQGATITVSPSSGLSDPQTVTVSGSGLTPNTVYHIGECAFVGAEGYACNRADAKDATTNASGAFTTTVTVRKVYQGYVGADLKPWGTVNCATAGCGVGANDNTGAGGGAPISFK